MTSPTSYDEVEYYSYPIARTDPDHLHCIGRLFGLNPPPVERARVLELGAGDGGNIIPLAARYPAGEYFGVDLSQTAVERGNRRIAAARLSNIELAVRDLLSFDPQPERFDYVIVHGVYSWVPDKIKESILRCIRTALSPNGIAFVSYNTLPGWHQRLVSREFMSFHTAAISDPKLKLTQARAAISFLAESASERAPLYRSLLAEEVATTQGVADWHLLHEYLEDTNDPRYFVTFAAEAAAHRLQYLGDSELSQMLPLEFPTAVQERIARIARDVIRMEQYLDFMRNRKFRRSLLVKEELSIRREFSPSDLSGLYLASPMTSTLEGSALKFSHTNGGGLVVSDQLLARALRVLEELYPSEISFSDLCQATGGEMERLAKSLLQLAIADLLELRSTKRGIPPSTATPLPKAFSLAATEATHSELLPNLLHDNVRVSPEQRKILQLCTGLNSREQIVGQLAGTGVHLSSQELDTQLGLLHRMALLAG